MKLGVLTFEKGVCAFSLGFRMSLKPYFLSRSAVLFNPATFQLIRPLNGWANLCLGFALNQRIVPGSGVRCRELAESSSRNEFGERRETATFARQTKKQRDLLFSFTTQKPLSRFKY
eukprot:s1546_g8.t1